MVGHGPLKPGILVRVQVPQPASGNEAGTERTSANVSTWTRTTEAFRT